MSVMSFAGRVATLLRHALVVATVVATGVMSCTVDTEGSGTGSSLQDGGGGVGSGGAGFDGGNTGGASGSTGNCFPGPGEKACGEVCPSTIDPSHGCASSSCAPCEFPYAAETCTNGACAISGCDTDYEDCDADPLNGCEVNVQQDPTHCGVCTTDCTAGGGAKAWECDRGSCKVSKCDVGRGDCDHDPSNECESDTQTDASNCGHCANVCNLAHADAKCESGKCVVDQCKPGWKHCDASVQDACEQDVATDINNCGDCDVKCSSAHGSPSCVAGRCQIACQNGWGDCNGDPKDGCETPLDTSAANCGACGHACSAANASATACVAGSCKPTCAGNFRNCSTPPSGATDDGCETDVNSSAAHCGACGRACNSNHTTSVTCDAGACVSGCQSGWGNCNRPKTGADDGCETSVQNSVSHCGGCGRACSTINVASAACAGGVCTSTCASGFANCSMPDGSSADDGCETNVNNDAANCGGCGRACSKAGASAASCVTGACKPTCDGNHADCSSPPASSPDNGCETDITSDPKNCGACGTSCDAVPHGTSACLTKSCSVTCDADYLDCSGAGDGCETKIDDDHCGACDVTCDTNQSCTWDSGANAYACK